VKIALISSVFFGCPNPGYGGLETVVHNIWKGLVKRGHKVVCFAPSPAQIPKGGFHFNTGPALNTVDVDWLSEEQKMWQKIDKALDDFDLVEGDDWFGFEYRSKLRNSKLNVCHRHHGHLAYWLDRDRKNPWWANPAPFKLNLIAISQHMKRLYSTGYNGVAPTIPAEHCYNGIDVDLYPYKKEKSDRLLFLGRIDPIKGVHDAIEVAERALMPIDVVGATGFVANKQYVEDMKARCAQSKYAKFVGEVSHEDKVRYLQNAKALVAASTFGEPFGLHFAEAGACGTPVITNNDGAAGEVVAHESTGFVCHSINEMVEATRQLDAISPAKCRERVERLFSVDALAARTEELYKRVVSGDCW